MTDQWTGAPLGEVAPAKSNQLPPADSVAWNLSLDEIEPVTGRILAKSTCRVADLGSAKCCFDSRHVLYSKLRPYLNKVALPQERGVGTSELIPMLPAADVLDREFLAFYLRSPLFTDFANAHTRGANLPRISMQSLWAHRISFPEDLREQRRIVARIKECMERVEEIEALQEESALAALAAPPAFLSETFTDLAESFEPQPIGDLVLDTRYGTSRKCSEEPEGAPILRIPNVASGHVDFQGLKYCILEPEEASRLELIPGDLLFVRTNGSRDLVGRCAIFEGHGDGSRYGFASYLIRARLDQSRVLPHFLAFFLNSTHGRAEIDQRRRTSAGQFNINSANLKSIELPVPPIDVQRRIISGLSDRKNLLSQMEQEVAEARAGSKFLRDAILRKAFAGEL